MENQGTALGEIGQIALTVPDLEEAKAFYRDVLGIPFLFDAGTVAFFQCGAVRLLIGAAEPGNPSAPVAGTILYFRVGDLPAVAAALREKGVVFVQEPHLVAKMADHDLWLAFFQDPAGHTLGLMSELPRS
ncbi:MAG TPA: VOC family protein [Acidobacteriaceae bacterium]|jgi:methylmalonyl-CoA/ethylmalonyl-CoA epimerase|nr:VOC family protein [Acidobacteriaceae bacterium]